MTRPAIGRRGYALLGAATMSRLAVNTVPIAVVLLAIARTHDPRLAGLLVSSYTVPTLIAGPAIVSTLAGAFGAGTGFGALVAALGGCADGPALAVTLTVRQGNVPPDRYAQTLATASSLKIAAFSAGSAAAGLLTGLLTVRQLILGLAVGQLLSATPLLFAPAHDPFTENERVTSPATPTQPMKRPGDNGKRPDRERDPGQTECG